ncbi:interferon-induced, double-stranded RNA-activated protein kinase-like, partial [Sorex fumeus]
MADDSKPGFYIEELNKFKQQHSGEVQYRELTDSPLLKKFRFALQVVIDGKEFPAAGGSNKKEAKNGAAKIALEILNAQVRSSFSPAAKLPSQGTGAGNHVGQLNTYAQKNGLQVLYDCEERSPQQFRVTCRINGKVYGRELAGSKQKAKQLAAQRALEKLHSEDTAARPQGPLAASIASSSESSSLLRSRELSTTESLSGRSSLDRNSCSESWASSQLASPECLPRLAEGAPPEAAAAAADKCPYTTERSFLEHFTDIKPIGKGGYGQVFKARHKIDGKTYVIKRVKYDNEKVKREVEALAELRHPNIVLYHDCWKGPDRLFRDYEWRPETECLFIKMEFCGQGTLDQWIDRMRHQKPDKTLALQFFKQIVE